MLKVSWHDISLKAFLNTNYKVNNFIYKPISGDLWLFMEFNPTEQRSASLCCLNCS